MNDLIGKLEKLNDDKLIDAVKNYRQYGYDDSLRLTAISILKERGFTKEELELTGNLENKTYSYAEDSYQSFRKNSKIAFIMYGILLITNVLVPIANAESEFLGTSSLIINITAFFLYFIYLIKSFLNQNDFYKTIGQDYGVGGAFLYLFIGMPFYIIMYFIFRDQMKEKMKEIK